MQYHTQIDATEPDGWISVSAPSMEEAAINALRRVGVKAVTWPCTIYVGDPNPKLQHDNHTPLVVHGFTLVLANEGEQR